MPSQVQERFDRLGVTVKRVEEIKKELKDKFELLFVGDWETEHEGSIPSRGTTQ